MKILLLTIFVGLTGACDHPLFCTGEVLKTIQLAGIYNDSKHYVDKPSKYPPQQVIENFTKL